MSHPAFALHTLDRPRLTGPEGPVAFADPRAFALLVLLAMAGEEGMDEDTLLLRLTPSLTPARGRGTLRELTDTLRERLGASAIEWHDATLRLVAGVVSLDIGPLEASTRKPTGSRFLRGFTVPDSPEFSDWVEEVRLRVAPLRLDATHRPTRAVMLGAGLVVVAAAFWLIRGTRSSDASRFPPGGTVVLADVDNATGDTLFDVGLTLAATVALEQSGHLGLLPRSRVRDALTRAGIAERDSLLTLDRAHEAAAREGVRFVIAPRIAAEGDGYRLSAVLLDAFTDRLFKEATAVAESRAGVLPALDQVLREIRATLGESTAEFAERNEPLPLVTTPSLEALRSYAQGARAWRDAEYVLAVEFWHRALDQDTGFAMAYHSVARGKALVHDRDSAQYYFAQAFARSNRLTEWERLRLEESWATDRGDRDSAGKIARTIAERFPTAVSWFNYGTSLMQANRCAEAIRPFEQALALDSMSFNTHINLATCSRRSEPELSLRHYERAAVIFPPSVQRGNQGYELGGLLVHLGLLDSASRQFGRMVAQTGMFDRTLGHRGLGFLALEQGRTAEAAGHFETTIEIGLQQKRAYVSLVRGYLFLGLTHVLGDNTAAAAAPFGAMMEIIRTETIVPQLLALAGWGLVRGGRVRDAEFVLLRLRQLPNASDDDRAAEALLVAAIALARGQPERADSVLSAGPEFVQPQLANLLRARAVEAAGMPDSAASIRTAVEQTAVFGTEAHLERIFQNRELSGRIPTGRK